MTKSKAQGREANPLDASAVVQTLSPSLTNTKLELPHIQQKSGTSYCGPTVVLTAYQRQTGLRLNNPVIVPRLASMVMERAGHPNFGLGPAELFKPLNFNFTQLDFAADYKLTDLGKTRTLALKTIRQDVIPELSRGRSFRFWLISIS